MPEAEVEAVAAQGAQAGGQPVHLEVTVEGRLPGAGRREPGRVEAVGQVGDRLLEAALDRGEVALVGGDQRRVGLVGQVLGKVERAVVVGWSSGSVLGVTWWLRSADRVRFPRRS